MPVVEVKVVGWDQKCSFSMFGILASDGLGRFVASNNEKFYVPDDAILWVRQLPQPALEEAPSPEVPEEKKEEQPTLSSTPSNAHKMAMKMFKLRQKKAAKKAKKESFSAEKPTRRKKRTPASEVTPSIVEKK